MTDRSSTSGALFATRLRLACAAVLWERVWPSCWPMLAALGVFLILGLFDVLPHLPGALHAAVLLGFAAAIVIPLVSIFRRIAVPDFLTGRRRIERASKHAPLEQLALSPQCGFSSGIGGNTMDEEGELAKLRLVVETAREVWGSA